MKLQILVGAIKEGENEGKYAVTCNLHPDYYEIHNTQILAMMSGFDHRKILHPKEDAKVGRRSKAAAEKRSKKRRR